MKLDTRKCVPFSTDAVTKKKLTPGSTRCYLRENLSIPCATSIRAAVLDETTSSSCSLYSDPPEDTTKTTNNGRKIAFEPTLTYTPVMSSSRVIERRRLLSSDGVHELSKKLDALLIGSGGEDEKPSISIKKEVEGEKYPKHSTSTKMKKRVTIGSGFEHNDFHYDRSSFEDEENNEEEWFETKRSRSSQPSTRHEVGKRFNSTDSSSGSNCAPYLPADFPLPRRRKGRGRSNVGSNSCDATDDEGTEAAGDGDSNEATAGGRFTRVVVDERTRRKIKVRRSSRLSTQYPSK